MGRVLQMAKGGLQTPPGAVQLGSIAEGSIVKLNENGTPVEFYVAMHDYEAALNGEGRTLLARKTPHSQRQWHTSNVNTYATSAVDRWLNGEYVTLLDPSVQNAIGATTFYSRPNDTDAVTTLSRGVFMTSAFEIGVYDSYGAVPRDEGLTLSTADILKIAYDGSGNAVQQWTRTPRSGLSTYAIGVDTDGDVLLHVCTTNHWIRPCFTLPATAAFDEETLLYKGVG